MSEYPKNFSVSQFTRDIAFDIILTIITLGIFNLYVNYKQMEAVNFMLKVEKYSFLKWFLLSLVTCGLYHLYHEYVMAEDIAKHVGREGGTDGLICLVLCLFGLPVVADAIQQHHINNFYGSNDL